MNKNFSVSNVELLSLFYEPTNRYATPPIPLKTAAPCGYRAHSYPHAQSSTTMYRYACVSKHACPPMYTVPPIF